MMAPSPAMGPGPAEMPMVAPEPAPEEPAWAGGGTTWVVTWTFASVLGRAQLQGVDIFVGDTVQFDWGGAVHDVWEVPSDACPDAFVAGPGMEQIAPPAPEGSARKTFTEAGTYWFACSIGSHCKSDGMLIQVTVI